MRKKKTSPGRFLVGSLIVFFASAFLLPTLQESDSRLYLLAAVIPGAILLGGTRLLNRLLSLDRLLLVLSLALCSFGILVLAQADPDEALSQALRCAGALAVMVAGSLSVRAARPAVPTAVVFAAPALVMLVFPLASDTLSFRLDYPAVALLMIAFTALLSARCQIPAMLLGLAGTALMLASGSPAAALVWSVTFLLLFWAYGGHPAVLLAGAGAVILMLYLANLLLPHLFTLPDTPSLFAEYDPGWGGSESADFSRITDSGNTVSLFPWLAVRFGWIFAGCVLLLFPVVVHYGVLLAHASRSRFHGLLAMGSSLLIGLTVPVALLSDFGIWPVQGLFFPGLTRDMPSLCAFMFLAGLLSGVSVRNRADLEEDEHLSMLAG